MDFPRPFYRWRPHPWHGLEPGPEPPGRVHAYIEVTPFDGVKYEVDKETGYLRVDRPQRSSSLPPTLYGFIPKTYCGPGVGELSGHHVEGDRDPLDICVLSERVIDRSEVILNARVVGGFLMIDQGEADDKIVAVLENDNIWGQAQEITDLPQVILERIRHYFMTYKLIPGSDSGVVIEEPYDRQHAVKVVQASLDDYDEAFGR